MADIDLKTETPDTTLPSTGFLFGADSQAAASPSVYSTQAVATALLGSTTLSGTTVTASAPVLDLAQTWNNAAVNFALLRANATDTASASGSLLLDLQVGGGSKLNITKGGRLVWPNVVGSGNTNYIDGGLDQFKMDFFVRGAVRASLNNGNEFTIGGDAILRRRAAANLQLGAADAAAPVAQTLSVQSVVAGTSNTAGANLTITGSQGTGTGAGGSIIFQVAPAGSSGTAQNAFATALTIAPNASGGYISASRALITSYGTSTATGQQGMCSLGFDSNSGLLTIGNPGGVTTVSVPTSARFGFSSGSNNNWNDMDVSLFRDAANTLALRNSTNAQEQRVYGSFTSATNFQRMSIKTLRESSGALSGATYVSTIAIPAYAVPVGVTTRVTTAITGATSYDVGDGTDADLWGNDIDITLGSQSRTADFTAIAAVDAAATARTVTLTANGSNFTGGVVEICVHYLTTEAD